MDLNPTEAKWFEAALALPNVTEGVSCAGTSIERKTAIVGKKAFLFIGRGDVRLKLDATLDEARSLAAKDDDVVKVGSGGWVSIKLVPKSPVGLPQARRWIEESYHLMAAVSKTKKR